MEPWPWIDLCLVCCSFSFDDMLDLKGNTAVYLLYAHARIASIIAKVGKDPEQLVSSAQISLDDPAEVCSLLVIGHSQCPCADAAVCRAW